MCKVLGVSKSGYYKWLSESQKDQTARLGYKENLRCAIAKSYYLSRGTYGSPRIYDDLIEEGFVVSKKTVGRIMKEMGLKAILKIPYVVTTDSNHDLPVYPNLVKRNFNVNNANEVWVTDITYIRTSEGWLYLSCVMDLYSRKIVGWAIEDNMKKELVIKSMRRALITRQPSGGLIHHSDRGSQYCSTEYTAILLNSGIQISMSRKGDPYDNACIESFHATIKKEMVYRSKFSTRREGISAINSYILWYNERRKHSTLGYLSPNQFERKNAAIPLNNIS
jgi:transposase InsO family protein